MARRGRRTEEEATSRAMGSFLDLEDLANASDRFLTKGFAVVGLNGGACRRGLELKGREEKEVVSSNLVWLPPALVERLREN